MVDLRAAAGIALVVAGALLAVASVTSVGEAQSWDVADAFAADSVRLVRRVGALLAAVGLAALVASTPVLIGLVSGTPGSVWVVLGWIGFAAGATLFAMALGLTAVLMPALGELARTDVVSPQQVADQLTRQAPLVAAFLGGNLTFLSWVPIGVGLTRSEVFPTWLGWLLAATAMAAWLGFLHLPPFQRYAGPLWPLSITLLGLFVLRLGGGAG